MAIDPNPPSPATDDVAAGLRINDDLPAYRALSGKAVASLVLGLASILTFTSPYFALLGVASIVLALMARRTIRRFPDTTTGETLVRAAVATSLLFCLSALTVQGVQDLIIRIEANRFASSVAPTLRTGTLDDMLYLKSIPQFRNGKSVKEIADEMRQGSQNPQIFEMETKSFRDLKTRMASGPDQTLEFKGVGPHMVDGMNVFAIATYEIRGPATPEIPYSVVYARARMKGASVDGKYLWSLEELKFPETEVPGVQAK